MSDVEKVYLYYFLIRKLLLKGKAYDHKIKEMNLNHFQQFKLLIKKVQNNQNKRLPQKVKFLISNFIQFKKKKIKQESNIE